jgi:hypothetical protein
VPEPGVSAPARGGFLSALDGVAVLEPHRDGRVQLVVSTVLARSMASPDCAASARAVP